MNTEALVEQIVNELYRKLQEYPRQVANKKTAIILPPYQSAHPKSLEEKYHIVKDMEAATAIDLVVISELGIGLLGQLALGIGESPEAKIVLECLLKGKPVYILEQGIIYRRYKSTAHRTLYGLYSEYENKIKQYGVRLIHDMVEILTDERADYKKIQQVEQIEPEIIDSHERIDLRNKKVILESDLTRAAIQGVVEVAIKQNAIITPLASDYIRAHHLIIKRI